MIDDIIERNGRLYRVKSKYTSGLRNPRVLIECVDILNGKKYDEILPANDMLFVICYS